MYWKNTARYRWQCCLQYKHVKRGPFSYMHLFYFILLWNITVIALGPTAFLPFPTKKPTSVSEYVHDNLSLLCYSSVKVFAHIFFLCKRTAKLKYFRKGLPQISNANEELFWNISKNSPQISYANVQPCWNISKYHRFVYAKVQPCWNISDSKASLARESKAIIEFFTVASHLHLQVCFPLMAFKFLVHCLCNQSSYEYPGNSYSLQF